MKKSIISLLTIAAISGAAMAQESLKPVSYPGSNWSNITFNSDPVADKAHTNTLLQGNVEQGIVWRTFDNGWRLNTYAAMGYSVDNRGYSYNNKVTPTLGVKLQRPWENGIIDIGVQAVYQNTFRGLPSGVSNSASSVQLYVQYWTGWDLKK
jgi:hypothetical protein